MIAMGAGEHVIILSGYGPLISDDHLSQNGLIQNGYGWHCIHIYTYIYIYIHMSVAMLAQVSVAILAQVIDRDQWPVAT